MAWLWGARRAAKRARLPNTQTTSSPCLDGDRPAARYVGPLLDDLSKVVVLRREAEPLPHRVAGRHPRGRAGELDACRRAERGLSEPSQARFRPPSRHASLDGALHAPLQRGGGGRPDRSLASGRRRGPVRCRRRARCREGGVRGGDLPQRPVRSVDTRAWWESEVRKCGDRSGARTQLPVEDAEAAARHRRLLRELVELQRL